MEARPVPRPHLSNRNNSSPRNTAAVAAPPSPAPRFRQRSAGLRLAATAARPTWARRGSALVAAQGSRRRLHLTTHAHTFPWALPPLLLAEAAGRTPRSRPRAPRHAGSCGPGGPHGMLGFAVRRRSAGGGSNPRLRWAAVICTAPCAAPCSAGPCPWKSAAPCAVRSTAEASVFSSPTPTRLPQNGTGGRVWWRRLAAASAAITVPAERWGRGRRAATELLWGERSSQGAAGGAATRAGASGARRERPGSALGLLRRTPLPPCNWGFSCAPLRRWMWNKAIC